MLKRIPPRSKRTNDPERTRRDILEVAMAEFASEGYSGARVDAIAAPTRTSKRMIYYYFGGKEQLYLHAGGGLSQHPRAGGDSSTSPAATRAKACAG